MDGQLLISRKEYNVFFYDYDSPILVLEEIKEFGSSVIFNLIKHIGNPNRSEAYAAG